MNKTKLYAVLLGLVLLLLWPAAAWAQEAAEVETLEELRAAQEDEAVSSVIVNGDIEIDESIVFHKEVVIAAGQTLTLLWDGGESGEYNGNIAFPRFDWLAGKLVVRAGGGKFVVCRPEEEPLTVLSGVAPAADEQVIFQVTKGEMFCSVSINAELEEDEFSTDAEEWFFLRAGAEVVANGELPAGLSSYLALEIGSQLTVAEGRTFRPNVPTELRSRLIIPEGSSFDGSAGMLFRFDSSYSGELTGVDEYNCSYHVIGGDDYYQSAPVGARVSLDPGEKAGFTLIGWEITAPTAAPWQERAAANPWSQPEWDEDEGVYVFTMPNYPVTVAPSWKYSGGQQDQRSAEAEVKDAFGFPVAELDEDDQPRWRVNWYEKDGAQPVSGGAMVFGLNKSRGYQCELLLSAALAELYYQPRRAEVSQSKEHDVIAFTLREIGRVDISGSVTDASGAPLSGVRVTLQQSNGAYSYVDETWSDDNGGFSFKDAANISSTAKLACPGYYDRSVAVISSQSAAAQVDLGEIALTPLPGNRLSLSLSRQSASADGNAAAVLLRTSPGLSFSLYNRTQGQDVGGLQVEYPYLYFDGDDAAAGDALQLSVRDGNGLLAEVSVEGIELDAQKRAAVTVNLVEKGYLSVSELSGVSACRAMLFDSAGKFLRAFNVSGSFATPPLAAGAYTLLVAERNALLLSVATLSQLDSFGLSADGDYVRRDFSIADGRISSLSGITVPQLDESKLSYTKAESTGLTADSAQVASGNFVLLRASYELDSERTAASGQQVVITLPAGLEFVDRSLTVNGGSGTYTVSGQAITVSTGSDKATIRFYATASGSGKQTTDAYLSFSQGGTTVTQPLGSAVVEVNPQDLELPARTASRRVTVSGVAPAGSRVTLYDNGQAALLYDSLIDGSGASAVTAKASGRWTAVLDLGDEAEPLHSIQAEYSHATAFSGVIKSAASALIYDPDYIVVSKATMINSGHPENALQAVEYVSVFDFINHAPAPSYNYWPAYPGFSFKVEFSGGDGALSDVYAVTTNAAGDETRVALSYDGASGLWLGTHDYTSSADAPCSLRVEYIDRRDLSNGYTDEQYYDDLERLAGETLDDMHRQVSESFTSGEYYPTGNGYAADVRGANGAVAGVYRIEETELKDINAFLEQYGWERSETAAGLTTYKTLISNADSGEWSMLYAVEKPDNTWRLITRSFTCTLAATPTPTPAPAPGLRLSAAPAALALTLATTAADSAPQLDYNSSLQDVSVQFGRDASAAIENAAQEMIDNAGAIAAEENAMLQACVDGGLSLYIAQEMNNPNVTGAATDLVGFMIDLGCTDQVSSDPAGSLLDVVNALRDFVNLPSAIDKALDIFDLITAENESDVIAAITPYSSVGKLFCDMHDRFYRHWTHKTDDKDATPHDDPSGYVYEAVPANRLAGVTATAYYKDTDTGDPVLWDASAAEQVNPLTTDINGCYAWMVPFGDWKVVFEKEGYATADSFNVYGWLPVPPPQTAVNVGLVSESAPTVAGANAYADEVRVTFSQYMNIASVQGALSVNGSSGAVHALDAEYDIAGTTPYARSFSFAGSFSGTAAVNIASTALNYAGKPLAAYSATLNVETKPSGLSVASSLELGYTEERQLTVSVLPLGAGAGQTLSVSSSSPSVLGADSQSVTVDGNGRAYINITGNLPGRAVLTLELAGTNESAAVNVTVGNVGSSPEEEDKPRRPDSGSGHTPKQPVPAPPPTFIDVADNAYYAEAVAWAISNNITQGTAERSFSPDAACTRGQMAAFLWRAAGEPATALTACPFADVSADAYYHQAVLWAVERGIAKGVGAGTAFNPNATCTRGQMAAFLYRYAGSPAINAAQPFADVTKADYYHDAVLWAYHTGVTQGTGETTYGPHELCTRSQIVTFLYRATKEY